MPGISSFVHALEICIGNWQPKEIAMGRVASSADQGGVAAPRARSLLRRFLVRTDKRAQ